MKKSFEYVEISGNLLTKNALLNFFGQLLPLLIGVITIPFIIHGLGTERFGLLSLAWVIFGYFTVFDLGLGKATTKFVVEVFKFKEEFKKFYWTRTGITGQGVCI